MTKMNLNQDKQRFAEWRAQRKHRQPVPENLWQLACNHIPALGITRVAREFRLNMTRLRMKALQAGIIRSKQKRQKTERPEKVAFQEISLNNMFVPPIHISGLVLERPDGIRVRIEGQLPDPEYVGKLATCLVMR
jgi:hypothetical protein